MISTLALLIFLAFHLDLRLNYVLPCKTYTMLKKERYGVTSMIINIHLILCTPGCGDGQRSS